MQRNKLLLLLVAVMCGGSVFAQYTEKDIYVYIDQYKELAINKMYEYQIPASITMAQGIFESACGKSRLAVEGNNHFGIKCHADWTGDTILIDDDELQECFRKYDKVESSYNDHSLFLKNRSRYSALFELDIMDYEGWAKGLKAAGYATNPEYANRLVDVINRYHLAALDTTYQERLAAGYFKDYPDVHPELLAETDTQGFAKIQANLDGDITSSAKSRKKSNCDSENETADFKEQDGAVEQAGSEERPTAITVFSATKTDFPVVEYPFTDREVYVNNRTYFVIAEKGDSYAKIARDVQSSERALKKYNDVSSPSKLKVGQVVYIEHKSNTGNRESYKVVNAETLQYIAQKNGVKLSKLYQYNGLTPHSKLKKGDVIKLTK